MNDTGFLKINVTEKGTLKPLSGITVTISTENDAIIESVLTNEEGQAGPISLTAPDPAISLGDMPGMPYADYYIRINGEGYNDEYISGVEIFPEELSILDVTLSPGDSDESYSIADNTLYGDYPPKIAEAEVKPLGNSSEIVLSRVVIPEFIIVHDGPPADKNAPDYYIRYKDYIKNVACSEIYSTWPIEAIKANVLAIMSFTLNRVYTEWYRGQGYGYTITSSTAYDHKWTYGRNTYSSINNVVDELFNSYLSRPNVKQPILTQYCDGRRVSCPNWMSQWGSKELADNGFSAISILKYYYGDSLYLNYAEQVSGVPSSFPGVLLTIGSSGSAVRTIQEQLNYIGKTYSLIKPLAVDGIYGERTAEAVRTFQRIRNLPITGNVGFSTWYSISDLYVRLSRISELQ